MPIYINKHGIARYIIHGVYLSKAEFDALNKEAQVARQSIQARIAAILQAHLLAQVPVNLNAVRDPDQEVVNIVKLKSHR
jgi:hypothetical protein